jgi:hypothetical protein
MLGFNLKLLLSFPHPSAIPTLEAKPQGQNNLMTSENLRAKVA